MMPETASRAGIRIAVENVFDEDPDALSLGVVDKVAYARLLFCADDQLTRALRDMHDGAYAVWFALFLSVWHVVKR